MLETFFGPSDQNAHAVRHGKKQASKRDKTYMPLRERIRMKLRFQDGQQGRIEETQRIFTNMLP